MTFDYIKKPMAERFRHLLAVISSERFLKMQGLGNEVPFFICPFRPDEAVEMARLQNQLINKLGHEGTTVRDVNLYDLSIQLLKERKIWEQTLEIEHSVSKVELKEHLQNVLDPESHIIPAIGGIIANTEFDVLFISGVGEVFPYIRSHNVLNNLQKAAKEKPTIMFFPGDYKHSVEYGASLDLFCLLHEDRYYRAFNIYHCET